MTKRGTSRPLTASEYPVRNEDGQDDQIAGARWQFLEALGHVVPAFLELLRNQVYPEYARLADTNPDYWSRAGDSRLGNCFRTAIISLRPSSCNHAGSDGGLQFLKACADLRQTPCPSIRVASGHCVGG